MLDDQPTTNPSSYILSGASHGRLRSKKPQNRAAPCELVGDLITSSSSTSRDPVQPHRMPGRDIAQRLFGTVGPMKTPLPLPRIQPRVIYLGEELAGYTDILGAFFLFRYTNKEACLQNNNFSSKPLRILKEIMFTSRSKPYIFHGCNWRTGIGSARPEGIVPPVLYGCNSDGPELVAHSPKVLYRQYCTAVTLTDRNWQRTVRRFCTASTVRL